MKAGFVQGYLLAAVFLAGVRPAQAEGCGRPPAEPMQAPYGWLLPFVPVAEKLVALSFDDGPNDPYTSRILDILEKEGAKATFFLLGRNVEASPHTARRILKSGHAVGNHSYDHPRFDELTPDQMREQIRKADETLSSVLGSRTHLFRPPFGFYGKGLQDICREQQYILTGWSAHANDWNPREPGEIAESIIGQTCPGAIFLLHDGKETELEHDRTATVKAVALIVPALKAKGYTFVTIPKLLRRSATPLARFENGVELLGVLIPGHKAFAGQRFFVRFFWRIPPGFQRESTAVFVHFRNGRYQLPQGDHPLPSSQDAWNESADVLVQIPRNAVPGDYRVRVGLYPPGKTDWKDRIPVKTRAKSARRSVVLPDILRVLPPETRPDFGGRH